MKQRFEVMLHRADRKPKRIRVLLNGLFLAVFLLSYMVILQPAFAPPDLDVQNHIEFANDNSYIIHKDGFYSLYYNDAFITNVSENDLTDAPFNELEIREE